MTSNSERRERVLREMVAYLEGVVDATIADKDAMVRVNSTMGGFYAQLDEIDKADGCNA